MRTFTTSLNSLLGVAMGFVGINLAMHHHISWWFLVLVTLWGFSCGLMAFNAGWEARADRKRR